MKLLGGWTWLIGCALAISGMAVFRLARSSQSWSVQIIAQSPMNLAVGVAPNAHISMSFAGEMDADTLTAATAQLIDHDGNTVPCRLSYNPYNQTATLDPLNPLAYGAIYQVQLNGGRHGPQDKLGRGLYKPAASSFTVARNPVNGPGGPILVIASESNPFSTYYAEILRAEGLNEFATVDVSAITLSLLSRYDVAILADVPLTRLQAMQLSDWVTGGGKLIAMHPDRQLDELLGVIDNNTPPLDEGYLAIDPSNRWAAGLIGKPIQYHGQARQVSIHGTRSIATLQHDAGSCATSAPAVTLRDVGSHGGVAAAFMFDLAKSVVFTRQGNPAWAGQRRSGGVWGNWTQSADLFYGPAKFDPQKDWCDRVNIAIPQADIQQRLLANMIIGMNLAKAPLPRLAYFPNAAKAVVVLTGDDHNTGGTAGRFAQLASAGTSGGMLITGTSYLYPGIANSDIALASRAATGFESALHFEMTNGSRFQSAADVPADWVSHSQLDYVYASEQFTFNQMYPHLPASRTVRIHGPVWSDYDSPPQVEFAHGVRLDTSYYYAPPQWVHDRPGFFTGSGLPMRFATAAGKMIDVYQAPTQITDESGQSEPRTINTLLDNAVGASGFYAAVTVNAHTDEAHNPVADAVIASAKRHDVPIISAERLLDFEDGRGNSFFGNIQFDASTGLLSFSIIRAASGDRLMAMVPMTNATGQRITLIQLNGREASFRVERVSGVEYAVFPAESGMVAARYGD
jgi:hypothetical protein